MSIVTAENYSRFHANRGRLIHALAKSYQAHTGLCPAGTV